MAYLRADRVKETSTFTGLGLVQLLGASTGFKTFSSVCVDGDTFEYSITQEQSADWESGIGTYVSSSNSIERTIVTASSNSNNKVNFGPGYKQIFISLNSYSLREYDNQKIAATGTAIVFGL